MTVGIFFGTNSGSTEEVADLLAEAFRLAGHDVTLTNIRTAKLTDLEKPDVVVLGACTWDIETPNGLLAGQLQQDMHEFVETVRSKKKRFDGKRFAVFGLGDANYTHFCNAAVRLETFVKEVRGMILVDSLRIDRYYFHPEESRKAVAAWAKKVVKTNGKN